MAANGPLGVVAANLNSRGMVGRIYVVNHYALLHTKYRSCSFHGFREDFLSYSQLCGKSIEANYLHGVPNLGPRGMVGMTYVEDHPTWLI